MAQDISDASDDESAMAAAMGFSSFGASRTAKKRRFDDAVVAVTPSHRPREPEGTGANSMPLHSRASKHDIGASANHSVTANPEEIDLEHDDGVAGRHDVGDGDQGKQDQLRGDTPADGPASEAHQITSEASIRLQASNFGSLDKGHAPGHDWARGTRGRGRHGSGERGGYGGPSGHTTQSSLWWTDYYDPSFNENPWEHLERGLGVEPRGTWLSTQGA